MDAGKSFSFLFEDRDWISKLGLGAVISMVPILNFAWSGYLVDIIRNVMNNEAEPLPAWDDLGKKFNDGVVLFGAGLVYALPLLIALGLPLSVAAFSEVFSGNNSLRDIGQTITEAGGVLFFCILCVFVAYGLVLSILYPAILVLFAREGTFASCFKLRDAFRLISKNSASFLTAWGVGLVASLGVGLAVGFVNLVVSWVPCIGWIIGLALAMGSGVYSTAVYAHLFGQFGRETQAGNNLLPVT